MLKKAQFITSAASKKQWIIDDVPEICFVGRSNVGKSSFINSLAHQKKLSKISGTPGKTRLLNFFDIDDHLFRIVDVPGYGFSKISRAAKHQFGKMMEEYFLERTNLCGVVLLVDLRRIPNEDDIEMYHFFKKIALPVLIIGTKLDKISRNQLFKSENIIRQTLKMDQNDVFLPVSNIKKTNIDLVEDYLLKLLDRRK